MGTLLGTSHIQRGAEPRTGPSPHEPSHGEALRRLSLEWEASGKANPRNCSKWTQPATELPLFYRKSLKKWQRKTKKQVRERKDEAEKGGGTGLPMRGPGPRPRSTGSSLQPFGQRIIPGSCPRPSAPCCHHQRQRYLQMLILLISPPPRDPIPVYRVPGREVGVTCRVPESLLDSH